MIILKFTWEVVQTLLGFLVFVILKLFKLGASTKHYKKSIIVFHNSPNHWGVSLGFFIFLRKNTAQKTIDHEYGHCIQSSILGPLYLIIVGIPSFTRATLAMFFPKISENYYKRYPENWADRLGGVTR